MNGFISESTSKISDGFGTAAYILVLYFFTSYIYTNIESVFDYPGVLTTTLVLLAAGIYMLIKAFAAGVPEAQLAARGLTAGLLLWQAVHFSRVFEWSRLAGLNGWLLWLAAVLITIVLWRKVLPLGPRFFVLIFLLLWAGWLYTRALAFTIGWASAFIVVYHTVRVAALVGVIVFLWAIVYRTTNSIQRKLCGVGLAFCVLLGLNLF